MSEVSKSSSVSYRPIQSLDPQYQFNRIYQQTGTTTLTLSANTDPNEMVFEIPSKVFNPAKTELSLKFTLTAGGAGRYNKIYQSLVPLFSQVQLYTRSGLYLMDYRFADLGSEFMSKLCTSFDKFMTNTPESWGLNRCNVGGKEFTAAGTQLQSIGLCAPAGGTVNPDFTDLNYFLTSPTINNADVFNFKIPLSHICPESILSVDKDLYMGGEVVLLRFLWNGIAKVQYVAGTAQAGGTAYAQQQFLYDVVTNAGAAAGNIAVEEISLRLAVEKNPVIVESIVNKCKEAGGMNVIIPFANSYKQTIGSGTNQTVTLRLNRSHGSHLLRVYYGYMLTTQANVYSNRYLHTIPDSYYTSLENERLQQFDLDCTRGDDYEYMRDLLKDTCIQNAVMHQRSWVHVDDFTGKKHIKEREDIYKKNIICGLPLDKEYKYDVNIVDASTSYDHYIFAVCLKNLNVSPAGISLV